VNAARAASPWRAWLAGLAIAALTLLTYVPALRSGFIWDDDAFLTANPLIRADDGLRRLWASTEPPDYFPLTSTGLWIEWRLWGEHAAGYHAVNVALHALAAILLWRVLRRLAVPGAWLAGAVYAVHPVAVESVAWITERKNVQPMALGLAALLLWLRADEDARGGAGGRRAWLAALLLFLLALLSKTSVVILPLIMLLCAWWRRRRLQAADLRSTAPFFALSAALGLVTAWYQSHRAIGSVVVRDDGLLSRLAIAGRAVWFYLGKALLPVHLAFVYPRWPTGDVSWRAFVPLILLVASFAVLWRARHGWGRPLFFALACFVVGLLPVLGLLDIYFMRYSLVADHWQYLSLAAIAALLGAGVATLGARIGAAGGALVGAALVAGLGLLAWRQQAPYRDVRALWEATLESNPDAWIAHNNLGGMLLVDGRLAEATGHFEAALALQPDDVGIRANLGECLLDQRRFEEAAARFREVLARQPDRAEAHDSLGLALQGQGRAADAIAEHEQALRLRPGYAVAHNGLGLACASLGRADEAIGHFEQAVRLDPGYASAHNNLGNALYGLGRMQEAADAYAAALRARPQYPEACSNLGSALKALGRLDEAAERYRESRAMNPALPGVTENLILVLQQARRFREVAQERETQLAARPDDPATLVGTAWLLATCPDATVRDGRRALQLASHAVELTAEHDVAALAALAAAHAEAGDFTRAVQRQEQALAASAAGGNDVLRARLEAYRRGEPCRDPPP
jgi:protein O-mannosyl-transferase